MLIDYNMTRDYCKDWSPIDAIREMVQNALDSNEQCEYKIDSNSIVVYTPNLVLPKSSFALGESQKAADSIGGYGEGFKIGMLVLERAGLNPVITTEGYTATGKFVKNDFTGLETFNIEITESDYNDQGITFMCSNAGIDLEELRDKLTPFRDKPLDLPASVDVLQSEQGKLFVNGLFVCSASSLTYGYNFAPSHISLNRDRNMTQGVTWRLGQYFAGLGSAQAEKIFNLIEQEAADISDLSYFLSSNHALRAELARLFFNKYGEGATISPPGTTYIGGTSGVSTGAYATRCYRELGISETQKVADPEAPSEVLKCFITNNKKHLRRDVRVKLNKLVNRAKGWKKGDTF